MDTNGYNSIYKLHQNQHIKGNSDTNIHYLQSKHKRYRNCIWTKIILHTQRHIQSLKEKDSVNNYCLYFSIPCGDISQMCIRSRKYSL